MTPAAPVVVQPDLEAWVWQHIGGLAGITSFAYAASQQDHTGWVYAHHIQVDARAKRKAAARDLAEQARQIITGLAAIPWPDGVVVYCQPTDGPSWLPDPDGLPRYTARYEIRVHPRPAGAILAAPVAAHPPRRAKAAASPA
jgi:hypothetical protein